MRIHFPFLAALTALLFSCGSTAVLYTDGLFQAAAPEVVQAWQGLPPWHDARTVQLPSDDLSALVLAMKGAPSGSAHLVALALTPAERQALLGQFPREKIAFVGKGAGRMLGVDRSLAWATVARAAAARSPGSASVLFPEDVRSEEKARFVTAWEQAGGGELSASVWPDPGQVLARKDQVFQWVGPEASALILSIEPGRSVHGDPGTVARPESLGLTWRLKKDGLGELLWKYARNSSENGEFLALESTSASR